MKRFGILLAGVLLLGLALAACNPFGPPSYSDDSQPINTAAGKAFVIELESNPTTGYSWGADFDGKMLSQVSKEYSSPISLSGMVGTGGTDKFVFEALAAGTTELKFKYYRSFEPPTIAPIRTKTFRVIIK